MPLTINALELKKIELDSLIDIIRSINKNLPEKDLYKTFMFTLRSYPHLSKMALYVLDEDAAEDDSIRLDENHNLWFYKEGFGTTNNYQNILLPPSILEISKVSTNAQFSDVALFNEFCFLIPIYHKNKTLAYLFLGRADSSLTEEDLDLPFIQALSDIIIVAVENKKLARKQKKQEAFNRQMEIAKDVQSLLLPKELPNTENFSVVASYLPHHNVGGDYYDFIKIDENHFLLCVADVSGKGVPAALLMSNFQAALRMLSRHSDDLEHIVEELNLLIYRNSRGGNFITAFFFLYNSKTHTASYINAGHNSPLLFHTPQNMERLDEGTTILGTFEKLPFMKVTTIQNLDDFTIFCYTDGFTETASEEGEEYGEENLIKSVTKYFDKSHEALHEKLFQKLHEFKGETPYPDDITLLSCKVKKDENSSIN